MNDALTKELIASAMAASSKAYCPYSKFQVGAAVLTTSGSIFAGCNVENASYGLTICAERNAIFHAVAEGMVGISALLIYTPTSTPTAPCGVGGPADGTWKLVIHPDFAINMNHPPERQLQFSIGQGATGVAYRDGTYQFTRRLEAPKKGEWDRKMQMTPELIAQIHKRLKWIVSFPLLRGNTNEAIGVLNIDGLADVPDDDILNSVASSIREKVDDVANYLALQRSICVGIDQLGIMKNV